MGSPDQTMLTPVAEDFATNLGSIMEVYRNLSPEDKAKFDKSVYKESSQTTLEFAKFMQTREAKKFVKKYGFPKELSHICVNDLYNTVDYSNPEVKGAPREILDLASKILNVKVNSHYDPTRPRSFDYKDFDGNWMETEKGNIIELNYPIPDHFSTYFMKVMPRRQLSLDVNILTLDNFDELHAGFPVFTDNGECKYVANINNGKLSIPDVKTIAYMENNFRAYFMESAQKHSA